MEISSNICSFRDAQVTRPFLVSESLRILQCLQEKKIGGGKSIQVKAISALQKYYIDEYYLIRIRDLYVHA